MPDETHPKTLDVSPRTLAMIVGGGTLAGVLIVVGAILPAEFNVDPLGVGRLTGIARLWAPEPEAFAGGAEIRLHTAQAGAPTVHRVEIPLGAAGWDEAALEYKVRMTPGESFFYRWEAVTLDGRPIDVPLEAEMHGHDLPPEGEPQTVVDFNRIRTVSDQGALTAPIDGIFGWYFRNHSEDPAVIRLEIEGYYRLVPPGEPGNEFRIRPQD